MLLQELLFAFYFAAVIHCQCLKSPAKIIKKMNAQDDSLRLIFAHRGYQTKTAVENSIQAVDEACKIDIDGIEIDVQIAKDGTLWPSHDKRVGRITNYKANPKDSYFDILKDDPTGPKNPQIRDMTHDQLNALFLRNTAGEVQEGVSFHSVEFVLNHVKVNYPHIVIVLDIKSADAVVPTAELVNRMGMQGQAVIKFLATWVSPSAIASDTRGVGFIVVVYCDMLDGFVEQRRGLNPQEKVKNYLADYFNNPNYVSMETPTKNWFVSNSKDVVVPTGPGGFVDRWMILETKRGIGKFHLRNDYELGTVDSLGHCCVSADSYLAVSKIFGAEEPDQRYDAQVILEAANWVTTDAVAVVLSDAVKAGYRLNTDLLCE